MQKNPEEPERSLVKEGICPGWGQEHAFLPNSQVMLLPPGLCFENHQLRQQAREKSGRQAGRQTDGTGDRETQTHTAPIHTHSEPERDLERETGPER